MGEDTSPEEEEDDESSYLPEITGPVLLFGNAISASKDDLLAALPARNIVDRLVSFYLNSKESTLGKIYDVPIYKLGIQKS